MAGKTTADRDKSRVRGKDLKSMFRSLEKRPAPDRLRAVADQLDKAGKLTAPKLS